MKELSEREIEDLFSIVSSGTEQFSEKEKTYLLLNVLKRYEGKKAEKFERTLREILKVKPSTETLLSIFYENTYLKSVALKVITELGYSEGATLMKSALEDGDEFAKLYSIQGLAKFGKIKALANALPKLSSESTLIFDNAVSALKERRSRKAAGALLKLLKNKNPIVRERAVEALGLFGGKEIFPALLRMLDDKEFSPRFSALHSIILLRPRAKSLIPLLSHRKAHIRWAALRLLLKLGNRNVAKKVLPLLLDKYSHVREAAREVIERFARPAYECDEHVYDKGRTVWETLEEFRRIKILREQESLQSRDMKEKEKMVFAQREKEIGEEEKKAVILTR